ncbi:MAG: GTPase Era [Gammaproteobacteria bacterium]
MKEKTQNFVCGAVAIIGRPNVGKSTFLNHSIGQKISITSRKPQTTRHQILGIKTSGNSQIVYVDTPGLQLNPDRALNRGMNKEVMRAIVEVDVVLFIVEAGKWTAADENTLVLIKQSNVKAILVVNKIDKIKNKKDLLPYIKKITELMEFVEVIPTAATKNDNISTVEDAIIKCLPVADPWFSEDQITDRSVRFLAAEMIREKLTRKLGDELPYRLNVTIDQFKEDETLAHIHATIWVESKGQKKIVIGKNGSILKSVGEEARYDMQVMIDKKVFLETWVKVKEKWSDNVNALNQFGLSSE